MQIANQPTAQASQPVVVEIRSAEQLTIPKVGAAWETKRDRDFNITLPIDPQVTHSTVSSLAIHGTRSISNRTPDSKVSLVYVNGIRTNAEDTNTAAQMVGQNFGANENELKVLHNSVESVPVAWSKVAAGAFSSWACSKVEKECIDELTLRVREHLENPKDRLILAGHSQGTQIIKNVLDRTYDEYHKSPELAAKWDEGVKNIEVVLFAALVRTLPPGPKAVSFTHSLDWAARSVGGISHSVDTAKHYSRYRQQDSIQTIIYNDHEVSFREFFSNPTKAHSSFRLILDDATFNFRRLSEDPATKKSSPNYFAEQLTESIQNGNRSDSLHRELIMLGCTELPPSFATEFLTNCENDPQSAKVHLGQFYIDDEVHCMLIERAAENRELPELTKEKITPIGDSSEQETPKQQKKAWWKLW